ncbi:MAG: SIS domain-containing protein [Candidatus Omnitrophota bacterium]
MDTEKKIRTILEESLKVKKDFLSDRANIAAVAKAALAIIACCQRGGKVIIFGNGGSAADSQHFAAELIVRFERERESIPALALTTDTSVLTAFSNDYNFKDVFKRQIQALAGPEDIVFAISTSGSSENVLEGVKAAAAKKIQVIGLSGKDGGELAELSDIAITVRSKNTARIQEVHITVIHVLCKLIEETLS